MRGTKSILKECKASVINRPLKFGNKDSLVYFYSIYKTKPLNLIAIASAISVQIKGHLIMQRNANMLKFLKKVRFCRF